MRLIDVNAVNGTFVKNENYKGSEVMALLNQQPTAYDVDKVVEQLEILPDKTIITDSDAVPVFNNKGSFEGYSKTYEIEKNFIDKDKAIQIVKSGGIEESGEE